MKQIKSKRSNYPTDVTSLPFVADRRVGGRFVRCWWEVSPTADTHKASKAGREYAEAYIDHLMSGDGFWIGSGATNHLIADMAHVAQRGDASASYAIAFFSVLEQYIAAGYYDIRLGSSAPAAGPIHKRLKSA